MITSMTQLTIWMLALSAVSLGALAISVAAFFVASRNSDQIEDADDKANLAHEIATGITIDDASVYGSHAKKGIKP